MNSKNRIVENEMDYEPMDTSEIPGEEGEIYSSEDESDINKDSSILEESAVTGFFNNLGKDLGFSIFGENDDEMKKLDRAKRFTLPISENNVSSHKHPVLELYKDLGIDKENERHYRFNAIHMRCNKCINAEDVFQYFSSYKPSEIELIDDVSVNVVWNDDVSAARALINMSRKIKNLEKTDKYLKIPNNCRESSDDFVDARDININIPRGFWRLGISFKENCIVLLRYATRSDKHHSIHNSEFITNSKRSGNFSNVSHIRNGPIKLQHLNVENVWKPSSKETILQSNDKSNPWSELAYEWGKTDVLENNDFTHTGISKSRPTILKSQIPDLRLSLTKKKERHKRHLNSNQNSSNLRENRNKTLCMKMYADDEEKRLERIFNKKQMEDLRSKINRNKSRDLFKVRIERKSRNLNVSKSEMNDDYVKEQANNNHSGAWTLDHYTDLRESLKQNKKHKNRRLDIDRLDSDEDDDDDDDDVDDDGSTEESNDDMVFSKSNRPRSPLQIEIENDKYYQNRFK